MGRLTFSFFVKMSTKNPKLPVASLLAFTLSSDSWCSRKKKKAVPSAPSPDSPGQLLLETNSISGPVRGAPRMLSHRILKLCLCKGLLSNEIEYFYWIFKEMARWTWLSFLSTCGRSAAVTGGAVGGRCLNQVRWPAAVQSPRHSITC